MSACKSYYLTRRRLLGQAGIFTAGMLGMPLRHLLAADVGKSRKAEQVILFWMGGGMSHVDTWDPKPGRPVQGDFEAIKTSADGIQISEIFPKLAKQMHRAALIRSIAGTQGDHGLATYQLQTSYTNSGNVVHPGIGSVVAYEKQPLGDLPELISISGMAHSAGSLGQKCEAYYVGRPGERDPYLAFPEGISKEKGAKRLEILQRMNARSLAATGAPPMQASDTALKDAVALMHSPALEAFDLDKEKPATLERYGNTEFGRGALLARRLVETGVRFVQVNRGGFDNHAGVFQAMRAHGDVMDPALAALMEDLHATGKLDTTLVVVLSEFGRTPNINKQGGRDHHASVFSCFMAGGGVVGGQVIGKSDEDAMKPAERPVKVNDLHASICCALGIEHTKEITTPQGRPMTLVSKGAEPVQEVFS